MDNQAQDDQIETVEAERSTRSLLRLDEVCARLGIGRDLLEVCLRWNVIEPIQAEPEGDLLLTESGVERIQRALRLHHDLGINWPGVAVILDLLDRLAALERELESRLD